mgnify:CR=1 FL=1
MPGHRRPQRGDVAQVAGQEAGAGCRRHLPAIRLVDVEEGGARPLRRELRDDLGADAGDEQYDDRYRQQDDQRGT